MASSRTFAALLTALALVLLTFQPLRSPWWTGYDYEGNYAPSGVDLFRGEKTLYFDHPGLPLQEALGATLTVAWLVGSPGESRAERANRWLLDVNTLRPYLRGLGALVYVLGALLVFSLLTRVLGHPGFGLLGGVAFLATPETTAWAAVVKPDVLVTALSVATVGLAVLGMRGRPGLYVAAAAVGGLAVTTKINAAPLAAPLVAAVLLSPPRRGWGQAALAAVRGWAETRRRPLTAAAIVVAGVYVLMNVDSARPEGSDVRDLAAGLAALCVAGALVWLVVRRTRLAGVASALLAMIAAALAGMLVPNALFASVPATAVRWIGTNLSGRGVNASVEPFVGDLHALWPWLPLAVLAAAGLARGLLAAEREVLVWAAGSAATGLLAAARFTDQTRYFAPAIALLVPLALRALGRPGRAPSAVAAAVALAALAAPLWHEIDGARDRGEAARRAQRANGWVWAHLQPREVALTQLESTHSRHFYQIRIFAPSTPKFTYRFLPAIDEGVAYVREHGLRVRYVISPGNPLERLRALGVDGSLRRVHEDVYELVRPKT